LRYAKSVPHLVVDKESQTCQGHGHGSAAICGIDGLLDVPDQFRKPFKEEEQVDELAKIEEALFDGRSAARLAEWERTTRGKKQRPSELAKLDETKRPAYTREWCKPSSTTS
jgi:hypothetical protein